MYLHELDMTKPYIVNTPMWKTVVVSDDHGGDENEDANEDDNKDHEEKDDNDRDDPSDDYQ